MVFTQRNYQIRKHNNSDIKFDINVIPHFEQPAKIPQKVVNPDRLLEDEREKTLDTNVLKYRRDEIINLPTFLDKFFDLNNYYTFGVVQEKSFIYSLLYVVDTNFKFLSETDQAAVVAEKSVEFLEALGNDTEFKRVKQRLQRHFMPKITQISVLLSFRINLQRNIIILDLNEKTHQLHREFNGDFTRKLFLRVELPSFLCRVLMVQTSLILRLFH